MRFPAAILLSALLLSACGGGPGQHRGGPEAVARSRDRISMKDVVVRQYNRGSDAWKLDAERAEIERNSKEAELSVIKVTGTWERPGGGVADTVITAPRARTRLGGDTVTLSGGVTITDGEGNTMTTDVLECDRVAGSLSARSRVDLLGRGFRFSAAGFRSERLSDIYVFSGGVTGRFEPGVRPDAGE